MENFATLVAHLIECDGAVQIPDARALVPALRALLSDPVKRKAMGRRAREALAVHQGAAARTAELLA
jgi:3-deoxy-D-manno-octulosonic-acid transferase